MPTRPNLPRPLTTGTSESLPNPASTRLSDTSTHPSSRVAAHFCLSACAEWTSSRSARRFMGARGVDILAGAVLGLRGAIEGAAVVSAEPSPATPQPPAFRTGPYPTDARLRTVLQVWQPIIFRRDCRATDALALRCAWLMQEPLGGSLCGRFSCASCMWPGALPARISGRSHGRVAVFRRARRQSCIG